MYKNRLIKKKKKLTYLDIYGLNKINHRRQFLSLFFYMM